LSKGKFSQSPFYNGINNARQYYKPLLDRQTACLKTNYRQSQRDHSRNIYLSISYKSEISAKLTGI